jgi:hypothetical protein
VKLIPLLFFGELNRHLSNLHESQGKLAALYEQAAAPLRTAAGVSFRWGGSTLSRLPLTHGLEGLCTSLPTGGGIAARLGITERISSLYGESDWQDIFLSRRRSTQCITAWAG